MISFKQFYQEEMQLQEAFDTKVEWKGSNGQYSAMVSDKLVNLYLSKFSNGNISVTFLVNGTTQLTNTGSQMQIFGAVLNKIMDVVRKEAPSAIMFTSVKNDGNRTNLYRKIVNRYLSKNSQYYLDYNDKSSDDVDIFVIRRKSQKTA